MGKRINGLASKPYPRGRGETVDEFPKTLITNPGFSEIWDRFHIYIYDFVLITFRIFSLYWVFEGKVLEIEPCRSLTSRRWNVATF